MKMILRNVLIPCLLGGFVATAVQAEQIVMTSPDGFYDLQVTDPVPVGDGSESLQSVRLQVVNRRASDATANAAAFEGSIGIGGKLHHERAFSEFNPSPTQASFTNVGQAVSAIDSHFLNVGNAIQAPSEAGVNAPSAEAALSGGANATIFGPSLNGLFGFIEQNAVTDIAYLVFGEGSSIDINFVIANGIIGATPSRFEGLITPGGDTGGPVLDGGGALDFSFTSEVQQVTLNNTGDADLAFDVPGAVVSGPDAANFFLVNSPDFSDIPAGGSRTFDVGFHSLGVFAGDFAATLEFRTTNDTGAQANVASFDLTATVPEPSTVVVAGLALVGLASFARRNG